jgi:CBS domain-containing protein
MRVRDAMNPLVVSVGPDHTVRAVARLMTDRAVGAAVVVDGEARGPGIITERDILRVVAAGQDPDVELVGDHLTTDAVVAVPAWRLEDAAEAMLRGGFRHLVVVDDAPGSADVIGVLSMRDVVRAWAAEPAITLR